MCIGKTYMVLFDNKYMIIDYSAHPLESRNDISDMYPKKRNVTNLGGTMQFFIKKKICIQIRVKEKWT